MIELNHLSIPSKNLAKKAVVFIHGWQGNKNSFKTLPSVLDLDDVSWFFPQAPYQIQSKENKFSWSFQKKDGTWEYKKPKFLLKKFIETEILSQFEPKNVFFMGFSQGATVCYEFILELEYSWGGVFPVAGFIRNFDKGIVIHNAQKNTPILIGHGYKDDVIPIESSDKIYKYLRSNNCNVSFEKYNGGHKISINYLKKVKEIINN